MHANRARFTPSKPWMPACSKLVTSATSALAQQFWLKTVWTFAHLIANLTWFLLKTFYPLYLCLYASVSSSVSAPVCICICIYTCICTCAHLYLYLHVYLHLKTGHSGLVPSNGLSQCIIAFCGGRLRPQASRSMSCICLCICVFVFVCICNANFALQCISFQWRGRQSEASRSMSCRGLQSTRPNVCHAIDINLIWFCLYLLNCR